MGARMAMDMVFDAAPAVRDFGWDPQDFIRDLNIKMNAVTDGLWTSTRRH
jgi:hypothetical protein